MFQCTRKQACAWGECMELHAGDMYRGACCAPCQYATAYTLYKNPNSAYEDVVTGSHGGGCVIGDSVMSCCICCCSIAGGHAANIVVNAVVGDELNGDLGTINGCLWLTCGLCTCAPCITADYVSKRHDGLSPVAIVPTDTNIITLVY